MTTWMAMMMAAVEIFHTRFAAVGSTQPIMPNKAMIKSRMTQVLTADQPMAMTAWMAAGR